MHHSLRRIMSVLGRGAVPVLDAITPVTKTPFFRVPSFHYPFIFLSLLMLIIQYVKVNSEREINALCPDILSSFGKCSPWCAFGLWCGLTNSGALCAARSRFLRKATRGQCCVSRLRSSLSSPSAFVYPIPRESLLVLQGRL